MPLFSPSQSIIVHYCNIIIAPKCDFHLLTARRRGFSSSSSSFESSSSSPWNGTKLTSIWTLQIQSLTSLTSFMRKLFLRPLLMDIGRLGKQNCIQDSVSKFFHRIYMHNRVGKMSLSGMTLWNSIVQCA